MHEYDTSAYNETKTYKQNAIYCLQYYKQNATRQALRKKKNMVLTLNEHDRK